MDSPPIPTQYENFLDKLVLSSRDKESIGALHTEATRMGHTTTGRYIHNIPQEPVSMVCGVDFGKLEDAVIATMAVQELDAAVNRAARQIGKAATVAAARQRHLEKTLAFGLHYSIGHSNKGAHAYLAQNAQNLPRVHPDSEAMMHAAAQDAVRLTRIERIKEIAAEGLASLDNDTSYAQMDRMAAALGRILNELG